MSRSVAVVAVSICLTGTAGCSLGQGDGGVKSDALFAHECWGSSDGGVQGESYDLRPDFFAAIPYRSTLQMRVQRGNDFQGVSDGLSVEIDDVPKINQEICDRVVRSPDCTKPDDTGSFGEFVESNPDWEECPAGTVGFQVALPAGVNPPGSPAVPPPDLINDPPLVHMALYLHRSCHNQNTVLYAVEGKVCFARLFSGDPNERTGDNKLTNALFKIQVGDIRDVPLGAYPREIPRELQTTVRGWFRFYFERGQPAQPFP
jgi:hypothetical protein